MFNHKLISRFIFFTTFLVLNSIVSSAQCSFCFQNLAATQNLGNCKATISWQPVSEYSSGNWIIERSNDAINFIQIGTLVSHPNTNNFSYTFVDENPYYSGNPTSAFYRIKVVNTSNGNVLTSGNASLNLKSPKCAGMPVPNLCSGTLSIGGVSNVSVCDFTQRLSVSGTTPQTTVWTSSNLNVANVSSDGTIQPVTVGSVIVTATQPICGKTATKSIMICPCSTSVSASLGAFSIGTQGYFIHFSLVNGATSIYDLEWVDLTYNNSGSRTISFPLCGGCVNLPEVPFGNSFKYRIAGNSTCGKLNFSEWYFYTSSPAGPGTCTSPTALSISSIGSNYKKFIWTYAPGSSMYDIQATIMNTSQGQTCPLNFQTTSTNPVWPLPCYQAGAIGWTMQFKVRAKCADGQWGPFSPMSAAFGL